MKKLQLKLEGKEQLSKEQMKNINGGYQICYFTYYDGTSGWEEMSGCSTNCECDTVAAVMWYNNDEIASWECGC